MKVGGPIPGPCLNTLLSAGYIPQVGHLVVWDFGANIAVQMAEEFDRPVGRIASLNPAKTIATVELFTGGMVAVVPYKQQTIMRGHGIVATGEVNEDGEGYVRCSVLSDCGQIIAIDRIPGYVDVFCGG